MSDNDQIHTIKVSNQELEFLMDLRKLDDFFLEAVTAILKMALHDQNKREEADVIT